MCTTCTGAYDGFKREKEKKMSMEGAVAHLVLGPVFMAKKGGEVFMLTKDGGNT